MGDKTGIEWTRGEDGSPGATWNPVVGCSIVSPGCTNCYAMKMAARVEAMARANYDAWREDVSTIGVPEGTTYEPFNSPYAGTTQPSKAGPVWTGKVALASDKTLFAPLRWRRPRKIFVNSMGDLFHESVPDDWIDKVFAVMALAPQHTFQVLTKRSKRMREYLTTHPRMVDFEPMMRIIEAARRMRPHDLYNMTNWPLPNVWIGVSAEDQARANERIPDLLATPATVRFVSAEPLLGPINLHEFLLGFAAGHPASCSCGHGHGFGRCPNYGKVSPRCHRCGCTEFRKAPGSDGLHWIIVGGESGPHARPMHPDWARGLRDQCAAAGVPFFFKQWGEWREAREGDVYDTSKGRQNKPPAFIVEPSDGTVHCFLPQDADPRCRVMIRVGKRASGRLLDGVEHNDMPGVS